ncbi:unnamed protein product, partial [Pylaiella littoralis]
MWKPRGPLWAAPKVTKATLTTVCATWSVNILLTRPASVHEDGSSGSGSGTTAAARRLGLHPQPRRRKDQEKRE